MNLLGVDIGGTNTKLVLQDADDGVVRRAEIPTRPDDGSAALARRVAEVVADWPEVAATGLSVAGLLDSGRNLVQAPNLNAFVGQDLRASFSAFDVRALENDVNCAVYGEWRQGAGRDSSSVAMFSLGTGVGGGLILDRQLWRGAGGLGAELGHMTLDPDGPECPCGLRGHVESWLGSRGFARVAREHAARTPDSALARAIADGEEPDARVLTALARDGCASAVAALAECGRWLGIACANVVAVLQPERIVIAGGSVRAGDLLLDPALREYEARCMDAARGTVDVAVAELGVESAAIGAALLARANLDADRTGTR